MTERPKFREFAFKSSLAFASLVGVTVLENLELVDAVRVYQQYEEPADGDIIPERHGCGNLDLDSTPNQATENDDNADGNTDDDILSAVGSKTSGVHEFGRADKEEATAPATMSPIITPLNSYFDRVTARGRTEQSTNVEVLRNENGRAFEFDVPALDQLTSLIYDNPQLYDDPDVRAIVECKKDEVIDSGYLAGKDVRVMIAPGENTFIKNFNIGQFEEEVDDRSYRAGLGTPNVKLGLLPPFETPDHFIIITGINKDEHKINRLMLHEWIHVTMFQDLSDTLSESDEQERFVRYVEKSIMQDLDEKGQDLPQAIKLLDEDAGETAPDLGGAESLQLKLGAYMLYMTAIAASIGAAWTYSKKREDGDVT